MSLLSKERDKTLIRRIINDSDRAAADELVSCYYKKVYRHIYAKMKDAELSMDIVQETFIAALKGLGTFSGEKASFKTWIERIADNKIYDYYRSRQHRESIMTQILDDNGDRTETAPDPESEVIETMSYEEMERLYAVHHSSEWEVFKMKVYEGYTFPEISQRQGVTISTVKSRYYAMVSRMRKEWDYFE